MRRHLPAAVLAAAVVLLGWLLGWHGVDTAAQVYRVESFRVYGFTLWDFSWYGGHWTIDYSLLYPALASTFGILCVTVLSAASSAFAFDRLARDHLGPAGAVAGYVFALGTLVAASIGQLTFLAGEGFGIPALLAASLRRYKLAVLLSLCCTMTSPLTGAFLALAAAGWALDRWLSGDRRSALAPVALAATAALPILVAAIVFPGDGPMPYPAIDWVWEMGVAAVMGLVAWPRHRTVALTCAVWMAAATVSEIVPSAMGGNIGRLEDLVALPVGIAIAWDFLPLLAPLGSIPLLLSQWAPAAGAFVTAPFQASTAQGFFAPLDKELMSLAGKAPTARVEVVPTEYHWEAAYVAGVVPLARGWERQLDEADNPLFYRAGGLTAQAYRAWLLDNGVRYVALADAPLDMAGQAESALITTGRVPGLTLMWAAGGWQVWSVTGSPGIVSGPATLVSETNGRVVLQASSAGKVTVRIRWNPDWFVADGAGCDEPVGGWTLLKVNRSGPVNLEMSVLSPGQTDCRTVAPAAVPKMASGPAITPTPSSGPAIAPEG